MNAHSNSTGCTAPPLALYAKVVVAAVFVLIFLGGLVTSWQAGMAVPDWPLSFGALNPHGWWQDFPIRLEHGHRQFAELVGLLTTVLCAWVWRNGRPLLWALGSALLVGVGAWIFGFPLLVRVAGFLGTFAVVFPASLLATRCVKPEPVHWLALAAYVGVLLQATLGGLRVTLKTAGSDEAATALRIVHGCVAQAELCLLVAIAAMLSHRWLEVWEAPPRRRLPRRLAWWTFGAVYVQLIVGATMRHLGAGLAIPTFPQASPTGSWLPPIHNAYIDVNFAHTRFGALAVTALIVLLAVRTLRHAAAEKRLTRPAWALLALLAIQISLGVLVIWYTKPRTLTTIHVVNGAILLATTLLLALRLHCFPSSTRAGGQPDESFSHRNLINGGAPALKPLSP